MITLVLNSAREVKELIAKSRRQITNINGVNFGAIYPMLNASNTAVWYYPAFRIRKMNTYRSIGNH
jgi:hypothetical protein